MDTTVGRLNMLPGYTGTLALYARLTVTSGGNELAAGTIAQRNGDTSTLTFQAGTTVWAGTKLNTGRRLVNPSLSTITIGAGAELDVKGKGNAIGSNLVNFGTLTFTASLTGNVRFNNNAGITNNGHLYFATGQRRALKTTGTGVILNKGTVERSVPDVETSISELPLINGTRGNPFVYLKVFTGVLAFTRPGPSGVSVVNHSTVYLSRDATLRADYGFVQRGGDLETFGGGVATINTTQRGPDAADVEILGGRLEIGADGTYGELRTSGAVTLAGRATWIESIDGTSLQTNVLTSGLSGRGVTIGVNVTLDVTTRNIPAGGVPANRTVTFLISSGGPINGTFNRVVFRPAGIWDLDPDEDNRTYEFFT
jgi:hypothetical protein